MSEPITFQSVVELGGKMATGIPVPGDIVTALGSGRRPAVRITVGGHTPTGPPWPLWADASLSR